jgi:hypothetical protein
LQRDLSQKELFPGKGSAVEGSKQKIIYFNEDIIVLKIASGKE